MTRVLIVDDTEESLYLLGALLRGNGYEVEEACHGAEALAKARQAPPDLIISDLLMPVMDGYTLLRHWKADENLCRAPFMIYTATYVDSKDEHLAMELGADAFLVKPTDLDLLLERIADVLAREETRSATPAEIPEGREKTLLKQYSEVLVRKLETKMEQLEQANRALQEDIAARKEAEEALRKLSAAVEQSPVAVVITDTQGNIEYVNPRFTQMTGYGEEELAGQNLRILKSDETPREVYRELWDTISGGGQWSGEFHNKKKDGDLYWDRSTISPIRDASGNITHYLGVKEDITAHKALESQYLQSQRMEAVGRLAGGIAHDFNNMLNVILGHTEMALLELKPEDPLYDDIKQAQFAASRSADLIRQLLAFSRRQTIEPMVIDLNTQIKEMQGLVQRLIGEDIVIRFVLSPDLWFVKMDPSQIDQIVANLAVNARDAMPDGGKFAIETSNVHLDEMDCRGHVAFLPGDYALLTVSDTGCGMSTEIMANIFEPFFTTKGVGKGTGLGLATVYGIIKQNNGFIYVYSEPGYGTTFRIYLPRHAGQERPEGAMVEEDGELFGHETILLVEDDSILRMIARRMLSRLGYTVLDSADPDEAIALCEQYVGDIDLLLTDVVMPVMNGKELKERICAMRPGIKVLYTSGYTADAVARRGVLEKGTNFIGKPFRMVALGTKVRQVLDAAK